MSKGGRWTILLAALVSAWLLAPAAAESETSLRSHRIAVEYMPGENPEHRYIEDMIRRSGVLERVAELLSPLKLPRRLTLRTLSCHNDMWSYYEDDEITLCYQYLAAILKRVADTEPPRGTTRRNLVIGAVVDAFFHEAAHAVFDMLEIPVLGRAEDAADQFSAYLMLRFTRSEARQLIAGAAFWFVNEQQQSTPDLESYANEHSFPAQRFINYICLAYGSDPELFAAAIEQASLSERAEKCGEEYQQVDRAFRRLILPYVDSATLAKAWAKANWLGLDVAE